MAKASTTIDISALKVAGETNKYITMIDGSGIRVHEAGSVNTNFAQINSNGLQIYKGGQTDSYKVAEFGETSYIGKHDGSQSYIQLDYHSLQLKDKEGNSYFYVSDLRNANGIAQIEAVFTSDGETLLYPLLPPATNNTYTVTVSDNSGGTITKNTDYVNFSSAPTLDATISVSYSSTHKAAKAYTIGLRKSNTQITACSFAQGHEVEASGICSHAEGYDTVASGVFAHAEGQSTKAKGFASHTEGFYTLASNTNCHAEGRYSTASGFISHAEGMSTVASNSATHAEGFHTTASGINSHAENYYTTASGINSHAEGDNTTASNSGSHAEGFHTTASAPYSHAEGYYAAANGYYSHAAGQSTTADGTGQTVIGRFNISDSSKYVFIIGNGSSGSARTNALTVDWNGGIQMYLDSNGTASANATSGTDKDLFNAIRTLGWYSAVIS